MGFTVELLADEPILIVTGKGVITVQDFVDMIGESNRLLVGIEGIVYRISDFREASTSFMELIRISQLASQGTAGSTTDPRIKVILVGTNQWVSLGRTIFEQPQYSAMRLPTLESLEDALIYARAEIAKQKV